MNYIKNSLKLDSNEIRLICEFAKRNSIVIVLKFSENHEGSVYIAQSIINKFDEIVLHRRKIKCTHVEWILFADASSSVVPLNFETGRYKVGANSYWKHAQPIITYYGAT